MTRNRLIFNGFFNSNAVWYLSWLLNLRLYRLAFSNISRILRSDDIDYALLGLDIIISVHILERGRQFSQS